MHNICTACGRQTQILNTLTQTRYYLTRKELQRATIDPDLVPVRHKSGLEYGKVWVADALCEKCIAVVKEAIRMIQTRTQMDNAAGI